MTEFIEAFESAEKELKEKQIAELKVQFKRVLTKLEEKKKEKERIEDEIRILKLDLEDLKEGKFDKIADRQQKSAVARNLDAIQLFNGVSVVPFPNINGVSTSIFPEKWWEGTWNISGAFGDKTFYF